MKTIIIIILVMSIFDLAATYFYVSTFHVKFPKLDYKTLEANPILRAAWSKLGIGWGTIVGGAIVFALLFLITSNISDKWLYYLTGVFSMMLIYHLLNFSQLANLKPAP